MGQILEWADSVTEFGQWIIYKNTRRYDMENQDKLIVETEFMKGIISRMLGKILKEKAGYDVEIQINEFNIVNKDDKIHVLLSIDAESGIEELDKLLKTIE